MLTYLNPCLHHRFIVQQTKCTPISNGTNKTQHIDFQQLTNDLHISKRYSHFHNELYRHNNMAGAEVPIIKRIKRSWIKYLLS